MLRTRPLLTNGLSHLLRCRLLLQVPLGDLGGQSSGCVLHALRIAASRELPDGGPSESLDLAAAAAVARDTRLADTMTMTMASNLARSTGWVALRSSRQVALELGGPNEGLSAALSLMTDYARTTNMKVDAATDLEVDLISVVLRARPGGSKGFGAVGHVVLGSRKNNIIYDPAEEYPIPLSVEAMLAHDIAGFLDIRTFHVNPSPPRPMKHAMRCERWALPIARYALR